MPVSEPAWTLDELSELAAILRERLAVIARIHHAPRREPADTQRLALAERTAAQALDRLQAGLAGLKAQMPPDAPSGAQGVRVKQAHRPKTLA